MLRLGANNTIQLTRGDTAYLNVTITNETDSSVYELQDEDTLTLTVKKSTKDTEFSFQKKVAGSLTIKIEPNDTKDLAVGKYKYDVQLNTATGDVFTIIAATVFEVLEEVT